MLPGTWKNKTCQHSWGANVYMQIRVTSSSAKWGKSTGSCLNLPPLSFWVSSLGELFTLWVFPSHWFHCGGMAASCWTALMWTVASWPGADLNSHCKRFVWAWYADKCTYQQPGWHLMVSLRNLIAASPLFQLFCLLRSATQTQCRLLWRLKVMTFMEIQRAVFHRDLLLFCF